MSQIVRLLPFETLSGPENMAADEVLLEAAEGGQPSLRFYAWQSPTLSLGYFQPEAVRQTDPQLRLLPFVRRSSGGATLVHDQELTYAIALPSGSIWQPRGQSWICRMHEIIARALTSVGIMAISVKCGEEKKSGEILCFLHQTPGDLVLGGHKIVGSAQRKQRGAILQHGAILLAKSASTPNLPGIREISKLEISAGDLTPAIRMTLEHKTGWRCSEYTWKPEELRRIAELAHDKYAHESWNSKR
jgi:lipoate-protein ligase A